MPIRTSTGASMAPIPIPPGSRSATTGSRASCGSAALTIDTTGVLGVWKNQSGQLQARAFPSWATIPSELRSGARAPLASDLRLAVRGRHRALRPLEPGQRPSAARPRAARAELRPAHILHDIRQHATLNFPKGEAARNYNTLQKLAYLGVLGFLIPLMILAGLTLSPAMAAAWPWLLDLFGGRQSARSIHFIAAFLLVLFVLVHLADGGARRALQRGPLDDHRPLPPAEGKAMMPATPPDPPRRSPLALGGSAPLLSGCDALSQSPTFQEILASGEWLSYRIQRLLGGSALAREYAEADMSPDFRTNGNTRPRSDDWAREAAQNFAGYRLAVDGLVEAPQSLSLADLRAMPSRTQITRHDCVEGWSAIGKWTGVPLKAVLDQGA